MFESGNALKENGCRSIVETSLRDWWADDEVRRPGIWQPCAENRTFFDSVAGSSGTSFDAVESCRPTALLRVAKSLDYGSYEETPETLTGVSW